MKIDLKDVTFLMLVRLDSIERLENILCVTNQLCRCFETTILVLEADNHNNNILAKILNKQVDYSFIEDKDPVLHKTYYFNRMAARVTTPYLSIWDVDIVIDKKAIKDSVTFLRKEADVSYPYNGVCYEVSPIIRRFFLRKNDIRILQRNKNKMIMLHGRTLVGGAVFIRTDAYKLCGMENEKHYGWGNDDFDRHYRFVNQGMKIHRTDCFLYHLHHPRIKNSSYRSMLHNQVTKSELRKTMSSSKEELL